MMGVLNVGNLIAITSLVILLYMVMFFIIAQVKKNNAIVDIAWGGGFILVALLSLYVSPDVGARQWLVMGLVLIWGVRLIMHIALRSKGKGEDFRYADMRRRWGDRARINSFFKIYMFQGVLLIFIAYPILLNNYSDSTALHVVSMVGVVIWMIGFFFEAVGDYQLYRFKQNPENKGKMMQNGLWKYTRHPNYFGEVMLWWGIFFIVLPVSYGWSAIFSPLLLTFLILKVSGIPLLEQKYKDHPDFHDYAQKTNAFIPWLPRKTKAESSRRSNNVV